MCARNPEQNIFKKYQVLKSQKIKRKTHFPGKKIYIWKPRFR